MSNRLTMAPVRISRPPVARASLTETEVIVGMEQRQIIAAHPRRISDHRGIFGVGLGFNTATDRRGLPYRTASQLGTDLPASASAVNKLALKVVKSTVQDT